MQLARVFEVMVDEANRATTGLPPTASAEELVARDAQPALKSLWEVYHVIHLEIVRQVWVHCTERCGTPLPPADVSEPRRDDEKEEARQSGAVRPRE